MTPETITPDPRLRRRNRHLLAGLLGVAAGMAGLAYASVPLYDLFCRATGFGGTPQRSASFAGLAADEHQVTVRFDASVNGPLPWRFGPVVAQTVVRLGEPELVSYRAHNLSAQPEVGIAVFNVAPAKAGLYFHKVQCFCFAEQRLEPGQAVDMPVSFYVDPAFAQDPDLANLRTITLSYTFYRAASHPTNQGTVEPARLRDAAGSPAAPSDPAPQDPPPVPRSSRHG